MREPGVDGYVSKTTFPSGTCSPSVREQASGRFRQAEAIAKGGPGNMNDILTKLRGLAQVDPQGVVEALRDNPEAARMLMNALREPSPNVQQQYDKTRD